MPAGNRTEQREPLRLALFGLGRMGGHHLTALRERDDVRVVAVADHGSERAREAATAIGGDCRAVDAVADVIGHADAAVVAVPTAAHGEVAVPLLEAGVACLVEKPIAASEAEAERMIAAADAGRALLQIGHLERFNPAVVVLREQLGDEIASGGVRRIGTRRTSRADGRTFDVDAVLDLMIHDLDLVASLTPRAIEDVHALEPAATFERASALLESGRDAGRVDLEIELVAERGADAVERTLVVESGTWLLDADLVARVARRRPSSGRGAREELAVPDSDPLRAQLDAFLAAVRGRGPVAVDGRAGLAALALAQRIRAVVGLAEGN